MTWKRNVLVVANLTAGSDELIARLKQTQPGQVTLLVPATHSAGGREAAQRSLEEALARFRDAGLEAEGTIGDDDACLAVKEIWDPKRFDEILVCTLPLGSSKWLHAGLPERIAKLTGAPVTHVVSRPHPPERHVEPAPGHEPVNPILAPFTVLGHVEGEAPAK
jgi:hypothetical protein